MRGFRVVWMAGGWRGHSPDSLRNFASVRDAVLACIPALGWDDQYVVRGPIGGEWHAYRDAQAAQQGGDGDVVVGHDFGI